MPSAQHLRAQIEAKIPAALSPLLRVAAPPVATGVREIDALLHGGLPIGAISEIVGPECSGRSSLALAFVAGLTQTGKVCAWVDVSDTLHPESAAAIGVDLTRLLWIRCGASPAKAALPQVAKQTVGLTEKPHKTKPGLPQGGCGHPRMEAKGLSTAVSDLLGPGVDRGTELSRQRPHRPHPPQAEASLHRSGTRANTSRNKYWLRLEQALRVSDLLLQAGGFSCIVLDMGSLPAEYALRVPLATWFRFRAAAERLQANVLLLTQHTCAKSSAGLVLQLDPGGVLTPDSTVFTGLEHRAGITRERSSSLSAAGNVLPLRKPPQRVHTAQWQAPWAGRG